MKRILFLASVVATILSCNTVTDWFVSDQQEIEMGRNFKAQIEADTRNFPLYRNKTGHKTDLVNYINTIGGKIANAQRDRDTLPFEFEIIDADTVINAFAVPGGFVYIYTGLIKSARNEDEIAGVIAHEVGHITKRHGVRRMVKAMGINAVLDLVIGKETALRTVLDVAGGFLFLKYSRDDEFQADSCAVEYMASAGYNPNGMKTFLEYLHSLGGGGHRWGVFEALSTHPPSDKRADSVTVLISTKHPSVTTTQPAPKPKLVNP